MHVLLHRAGRYLVKAWAHYAASLVGVVQDISVSDVLSMYAASALDHGKLLCVEILI